MRQLIVTEFVSLDGVMEAPGGEAGYAHAGWVGGFFSDELGAWKGAEQLDADILLLGRVTYESFVGAWPGRDGSFAEKINTMPKFVASTTLGSSDWTNTTVWDSDVLDHVRELTAQDAGPILVAGSRTLVHDLLTAGLVDQLNLQVFPIALGSGRRVWPESHDTRAFELVSSQQLPNGVLAQQYHLG
jgi:dihydrofolate reductase